MTVNPHSGTEQKRYEIEVEAMLQECASIIGACSKMMQACHEAKAQGTIVRIENYETTLATSLRALQKKIGILGYLQSIGLKFRTPPKT